LVLEKVADKMEKNTSTGSALILGVTASLGVGYLLGSKKKDILSAIKNAQSNSGEKLSDQDEVERLIRANILKLAPYRCARDDYDRGK
jgi:hypothetical protein